MQAVKPLTEPRRRELAPDGKRKSEILIDHVSQDQVIEAGFSATAP
jgi:type I restriction enzyme R subunit